MVTNVQTPSEPASSNPLRATQQSRRDRAALLTSFVAIAYKALDAGAKLLIIPQAAKLLGLERYGIWLTANSLLNLLMISDFGIGSGLINAVSGARAEGDDNRARSLMATAYASFGCLALALIASVAGLSRSTHLTEWLGATGDPLVGGEARSLCLLLGILVGTAAFLNAINYFTSAMQEGYLANLAQIAGSLASLAWILSLHTRDMSQFALSAAGPGIAASLILTVFVFAVRHPSLRPAFRKISARSFSEIWRYSSRLLIAQIADTVVACGANVMIAHRLGSASVPLISVSMSVMMIFNFVSSMFILPLWPAYVEAQVRGDLAWIRSAFWRGARRSVGTMAACCLIYAIAYRTFLHVWSRALPIPPAQVIIALGLWFTVYAWNKNTMVLLNGLGYVNTRAWVAPIAALAFVIASLALLPSLGLTAIPIGGLIGSAVEALITAPKAMRLLDPNSSPVPSQPPACAPIG